MSSGYFYYTNYLTNITSTALSALYYDSSTNRLVVEFHNGNRAGYKDFPYAKFVEFVYADSKGRFYNNNVLHKHDGFEVPEILARRVYDDTAQSIPSDNEEKSAGRHVEVTVEISGTLVLNLGDVLAEQALRSVQEMFGKNNFDGTLKVRSVTQHFE